MSEEQTIREILEFIRRDNEGFDPHDNEITADTNEDNLVYEQYIRDFFKEYVPLC